MKQGTEIRWEEMGSREGNTNAIPIPMTTAVRPIERMIMKRRGPGFCQNACVICEDLWGEIEWRVLEVGPEEIFETGGGEDGVEEGVKVEVAVTITVGAGSVAVTIWVIVLTPRLRRLGWMGAGMRVSISWIESGQRDAPKKEFDILSV